MIDSSTWLALVALGEAQLPDPQTVIAACGPSVADEAPLTISSQTDAMVTFRWGEATIAYTLVDRPIPAQQLAGPCACAWYWPEAATVLARHQAHLIVALIDERADRIAKSLRLTRFASAVLPSSTAVGLQWGGSRSVHEPTAFCQVASQMSRDDLPLHLWIDFRVEPSQETHLGDGLRLFTTGLAPFARPEIEVPHFTGPPQELISHAYNLAHYLLEKGSVIQEGQQIGLPGEVQVTAHLTTSFLGGDQQVLRIDFAS